jgi:hypothetical protein
MRAIRTLGDSFEAAGGCEEEVLMTGADTHRPLVVFLEAAAVVRRRTAVLAEAVAAIDRAVAPGPERDHRLIAALGAHDRVHLPGPAVVPAGALFRPPG